MSVEQLFQQGVNLAASGNYHDALDCFNKIIEENPMSPEVWNNKAFVLAYLGKNEEAVNCCEKAIILNPRYSDPWDIKARVLGRLGRYEEAAEAIKKFIKLAPPEYWLRVEQAKQALKKIESQYMFNRTVTVGEKSWWQKLFRK